MANVGLDIDRTAGPSPEQLLLAHPAVAQAALLREEAADGRKYLTAYVVPDPDHVLAAKARLGREDREKRVAQWKMSFDLAYRGQRRDPRPSFAGWKSSYTNVPIPESEMREWRDATVARILSLRPRHVLEIGCGVGLLVEAVAPHCASYRGCDVSPVAISGLRDFIATEPDLHHVTLFEGEAADLRDQPTGSADTIMINSVIQYFPDLDYLRQVIAEAVRVTGADGRIFIGDVRHCGLLPLFHGAVQLARAPGEARVRWLKRRVALAVEQERELAVDPRFFLDLRGALTGVADVEVLLRRGRAHNEMTRYRYDVILHVGDAPFAAPAPAVDWQAHERPVAELIEAMEAGTVTSATVKNVPNRRLALDLAALAQIGSADDRDPVDAVRLAAAATGETGCDPEEFWALADRGLCDIRIGWSPDTADGCFDVMLVARGRTFGRKTPSSAHAAPAAMRPLATDPLAVSYRQQLGEELLQILCNRLPEAARPAAVLAVTTIPQAGAVAAA